MCNCPELIGIGHYVELNFEIKVTASPVISREKEYVTLQRQGSFDVFSIGTCDVAGECSSIIDESESGRVFKEIWGLMIHSRFLYLA